MSATERTALAISAKLGGPSSRPESAQSDYGAVRRNYTQELDGVEDDGKAPAGAIGPGPGATQEAGTVPAPSKFPISGVRCSLRRRVV